MKRARISSPVEPLESRIAPAVVTATFTTAGLLTLTSDGSVQADVVQVSKDNFRVSVDADSSVRFGAGAGAGYLDFKGALTGLIINGGTGDDEFRLIGLKALKSLTFVGGNGDDKLSADDISVAGNVSVSFGAGTSSLDEGTGEDRPAQELAFGGLGLTVTGKLQVDCGANGVRMEIKAATTAMGSLAVTGGDGTDKLSIQGQNFTLTQDLAFIGGDGLNSVNLSATSISIGKSVSTDLRFKDHSITFEGGSGADSLDLAARGGAKFAGSIFCSMGQGNNSMQMSGDALTLGVAAATGDSVSYAGGDGIDTVVLSAPAVTTTGAINVSAAGAGQNKLSLAGGVIKLGKNTGGRSVIFSGGADTDDVTVGSARSASTLAGAVSCVMGDGTNSVTMTGGVLTLGSATTAVVALGSTAGDSISYSGGSGTDNVQVTALSVTTAGVINISNAGNGNNVLALTGDVLKLGKNTAGNSVAFTGGADADTVTIGADRSVSTLAGAVTFSSTAGGDNALLIDGTNVKALAVNYTGGAGSDTFESTATAADLLSVAFNGGNGDNAVSFEGSSLKLGKSAVVLEKGNSLTYTGGTGDDSLTLDANKSVLLGGVAFTGGDGLNNATLLGASLTLGASTATADGGSTRSIAYSASSTANAGDTLSVGADLVVAAGSIEMIGSTGAAVMSMSITSTDVTVGLGKVAGDSVLLKSGTATSVVGSINIDSTKLTLKGNLASTGIDAGLSVDVVSAKLSVLGAITVASANGADHFQLIADGTVAKASSINLGATNSGDGGVQDVVLKGRSGNAAFTGTVADGLIFTAGLAVTSNSVAGGPDETLDMAFVSVGGDLVATFGAAASTVTIDNLLAKGLLTINTGDGNDVVKIETLGHYGISTVTKLATILLGAGDDRLEIGDGIDSTDPVSTAVKYRNNQVSFLLGLTANGGDGTDTKNSIQDRLSGGNNLIKGAFTLGGFEG